MRHEADENPVLIDTGLRAAVMKWNSMGTVLAIAGTKNVQAATPEAYTHMVQFYDPFGKVLQLFVVVCMYVCVCVRVSFTHTICWSLFVAV